MGEYTPAMQSSIEGKRVAALIGDGFEEAELGDPRRAFEEGGAIVTIVGVDDKAKQRIRGKRGLDDAGTLKAEELVADVTARGRTITGSPAIADDIRNAGGLYRDQAVVTDANWVTARTSADMAQFTRVAIEKLATAVPAGSS
jgi:putative intracellular protease/amidase